MFSACFLSFSVTCCSQGYTTVLLKRIENNDNKTTMNDLIQSIQSERFLQTIDQFEYVYKENRHIE